MQKWQDAHPMIQDVHKGKKSGGGKGKEAKRFLRNRNEYGYAKGRELGNDLSNGFSFFSFSLSCNFLGFICLG